MGNDMDGTGGYDVVEVVNPRTGLVKPLYNMLFPNLLQKPDGLLIILDTLPEDGSAGYEPNGKRRHILSPLDEVYIGDGLKDRVIERLAVPELLEGRQPVYRGAVLHGPAGVGKSKLQKAACEVYRRAGAHVMELSISDMDAPADRLAANIERVLKQAIKEAGKRSIHSLVSFDGTSHLVMKPGFGSEEAARHYYEMHGVFRRYVSESSQFVVAVSTSSPYPTLSEALTGDGMFEAIFIPPPDMEQKKGMWKHFLKAYGIVLNVDEETAEKLASATGPRTGAFIEQFCKAYRSELRDGILKESGHTLLHALEENIPIPDEAIEASIKPEQLLAHLGEYIESKRQADGSQISVIQGFGNASPK